MQPQAWQQPPQQPYQQPYQQPQQPQWQQHQQPMPGQHQMPPQTPPPGSVNHQNFMQMASMWRGGPAMKSDPGGCPECGSPRFYSRAKTVSRGPAPAPHCFDCGFNGMFDQGDPATWGAA